MFVRVILHVILFLTIMCFTAQATTYKIHDLGGPGTDAYAINNHNQVVGFSMVGYHAVATKWGNSIASYVTDPATTISTALGINDQGEIVGSVRNIDAGTDTDVAFYLRGGNMTYIASLSAVDVNSAGQVTGSSGQSAVVWSESNGLIQLKTYGEFNIRPQRINESGQIAGGLMFWNTPSEAVDLAIATGQNVNASGINDNGQVVGSYISTELGQRAFIWDATNGMTDLGISSGAADINNQGEVIGTDNSIHAFYWNGNDPFQLESLTAGGMTQARDINDNGWICGRAWDAQGSNHAVVWEPVPEPSSILALLCGIGGLSGFVWRRKSQ